MTKTIGAIYDTLSAMTGFIKSLTAWFGFGPVVVLIFLLFFFKLFQSLLGAGRIVSLFFSFISLTALWLTWNLSYYEEYKIFEMIKIYGFIFLHLLAVFALYKFLSWSGKYIYRAVRNRRRNPYSTLEIYEKIDENITVVKTHIRNHDNAAAANILNELYHYIKMSPVSEKAKNGDYLNHTKPNP
jgi:hypothetical protein